MTFLLVNTLRADASGDARTEFRDAHIAHVQRNVESGLVTSLSRLFDTDGTTLIGGHFLLDTDSAAAAQAFYEQDPYVREGIWESTLMAKAEIVTPEPPPPPAVS